jgi:ribosome biogenesis GTPase
VRDEDDEHAAFERPKRRTRPRTKDRPNYDDAEVGRVITVDRGRYTVVVGDEQRVVTAMKSRPLGRQGVVVGDEVKIVGDVSGDEGSLARIVEVEPRRTVLRRTADDDDPIERVVVANADQLVVVAALADPPMRLALVDRCLVAAFDAGMDPIVCLTKSDLAPAEDVVALLEPLDVRTVVTRRDGDLDELRSVLHDRTSVLVGHSGVGKSTLVNLLVPDADRTTSHVNVVTGRGRQTSTSAMVLELPGGGWIIDTPGFRSFGLAHVEVAHVIRAFPDLDEVSADCPRGCTHAADEPECALDVAMTEGRLRPDRVASFRRILASRDASD